MRPVARIAPLVLAAVLLAACGDSATQTEPEETSTSTRAPTTSKTGAEDPTASVATEAHPPTTTTGDPEATRPDGDGSGASPATESSWGVEETVTTGDGLQLAFNSTTSAARLADGTVVVAYTSTAGTSFARRGADGSWASSRLASPAGTARGEKPALVELDDGSLLVAWSARTSDEERAVLSARSRDGGRSFGEVESLDVPSPRNGPVALSAQGSGALLAIVALDGSVVVARHDGSRWAGGATIAPASEDASDVSIESCRGVVVAAWESPAGSGTVLRSARSTDGGGTFGPPEAVTVSGAAQTGGDPSVACEGSAFYLGYQDRGQVWIARSDGGVGWTTAYGPQPGLFMQVHATGGTVAATWEMFNGNFRDDTIKRIGLAIGGEGLASVDGPLAEPEAAERTGQIRPSILVDDGWLDLYWVDTTTAPQTLRHLEHRFP